MKIIACGDTGTRQTGISIVSKSLIKSVLAYGEVDDKTFELHHSVRGFKNMLLLVKTGTIDIFLKVAFLKRKKGDVFFLTHSLGLLLKVSGFLLKGPKMMMVHDLFFVDMYKDKTFPIYARMGIFISHRWLWKSALQRFDVLFTVSEKVRQDLIKEGFAPDKIFNTNLGINAEYFEPFDIGERPIKEDYIFVIGTELERKNMAGIIEAFNILKKSYPNLKMIKAGSGTQHPQRESTLKLIEQTNPALRSDIIFIDDEIEISKIKQYHAHAKLFLFPSHKEGFGLPIVEAQASGVPVITTSNEPMASLIPYKELLVNSKDPKDIAQKCQRLFEDEDYRQSTIVQGKENAKRFTWEEVGKIIYTQALKLAEKSN